MSLTEELFKRMQEHPLSENLTFPPNVYYETGSLFLDHREKEFFKISVPLKPEYNNPGNTILGGYYGMFFDMAFGPFSFLILEKYATTLELNVSFLKPLIARDDYVIVEARPVSISKSFLLLEGKAYTREGVLVATATSRMMVLRT